jgi:diketogulonate reductase-like aldo/keto reductase
MKTDPSRAQLTSRRNLIKGLGMGIAATATLPALSSAARAQSDGSPALPLVAAPSGVITRTAPKIGEALPLIGLGTFLTFDVMPGNPRAHLKDVLKTYWDGGARVIDTSPLYGTAEFTVGAFASELGATSPMFLSNKIWSTGEFANDESHAVQSLRESKGRMWREQIDVLHCHSITNADGIIPLLQAWKAEGHLRFIGITHHENVYHDALVSWMERGMIDMIQVNLQSRR